jgi:hypothetical protein
MVIKYSGEERYCSRCKRHYEPPTIKRLGGQTFGRGFRAWAVYQRIVLRLPYRPITQAMEELFHETASETSIISFVEEFAEDYRRTESILVTCLRESPFVHVDETRLSIGGVDHYVRVFTDGRHVVFRLTETRETKIVQELLRGYQGVLVSDFYAGYDPLDCRQEKCWVHLIRDSTPPPRIRKAADQGDAMAQRGNNESILDRLDWQPGGSDAFHLNLFVARNWFQVPNAYEQLLQDQKQRAMTWMIAPGYQHTFNSKTLLTVNPFVRRDQINYYASRDPFHDNPITAAQNRFLTNYGLAAGVTYEHGKHTIEFGTRLQQTRLLENFDFGITNPAYNPVCLDAEGNFLLLPGVTNPDQCSSINPTYMANPNLQPGIVPYDLTRGGSLFFFHGKANINQYGFYVGDTIKTGHFTIDAGLREDQYNGLASANGVQPRLAISYFIPKTNTVLRVGYARTFETPFNENLILSSGTGPGGLSENVFGSVSAPIRPGNRNQFNTGLQQAIGKWIVVDGDYFWKYTHNAYDFSVLFNTPITFPIAWHNSKLDGVVGRVSTVSIHGFQGYLTLGHTRARYFPPENGGLIPLGGFPTSVFRIDHDQAYEQNVILRYARPKNTEWIEFTWRYDSGLVVSGVPDVAAALTLTPAQQVTIGFSCDGVFATFTHPITVCNGVGKSTLLRLPQTGTENDDHNPDRVKPRNLFNLAIGTDNLFHSKDSSRITLRFAFQNMTNKVALYNFLSTFSETHFVPPRNVQITLGSRSKYCRFTPADRTGALVDFFPVRAAFPG